VESPSDGWSGIISAVERCCAPDVHVDRSEFVELVKRINAEGPVFFVRENGTLTAEGWFVREIKPVEYRNADGGTDTRVHIVLSPTNNIKVEEEYALGDFFANRIIGSRRISERTT